MTRERSGLDPMVTSEVHLRLKRIADPLEYHSGRPDGDAFKPRSILIFRRTQGKDLPLSFIHQHHRYVLITAVQGQGSVGINTRTHLIRKGESLLVLPFQAHWYEDVDADVLWAFVTFEHARDRRLDRLSNRGAIAGDLAGLRDILRAWQEEAEADFLGMRLAIWLHRLTSAAMKRARPARPGEGEFVGELNRFVFENRSKPIGTDEIARSLGISSSLLRSKFRRLTGQSVGGYVRRLKLQYACELLHDTKLQIGEVAERCGYDSLFSFSRAFQSCYRMSPSGYRRQLE